MASITASCAVTSVISTQNTAVPTLHAFDLTGTIALEETVRNTVGSEKTLKISINDS